MKWRASYLWFLTNEQDFNRWKAFLAAEHGREVAEYDAISWEWFCRFFDGTRPSACPEFADKVRRFLQANPDLVE